MCDGHARCTRYPVYRVKIHRTDYCNRPPGPDAVYDMCPACTRATAYRIEESLNGSPFLCRTCGKGVRGLHDVFDVEYARAGV